MPAIERLREEGYEVSGPHPPDIMFHERRRRNYDAALCMYHDQALIPLKTLHFDEGINCTLGPADRAHLARSRHRFRHCRQEPRRSRRDDHRHPDRRRLRAPARRRVTQAGLPPLRDVIARHGLSASKALGQNFLLDEQLLDRIARVPGPLDGERVYEVGPGPGGLTRALLRAGAQVTAVERDRRCLAPLAELAEASGGRLDIIEGDALAVRAAVRRAYRRQPAL